METTWQGLDVTALRGGEDKHHVWEKVGLMCSTGSRSLVLPAVHTSRVSFQELFAVGWCQTTEIRVSRITLGSNVYSCFIVRSLCIVVRYQGADTKG